MCAEDRKRHATNSDLQALRSVEAQTPTRTSTPSGQRSPVCSDNRYGRNCPRSAIGSSGSNPAAASNATPPRGGILPDRATQPRPALTGAAVAYQFATDDPVVLGFRLPAKRGEPFWAETCKQRRIAEDRIHAGRVGGGVEGEATTGATWMPSDEQHRCAAPRRGEWTLQGDADPELPVLAIGDAGDEAAGFRTASARSSRWPPLANRLRTSSRRRISPDGGGEPRPYRRMHRRHWPRQPPARRRGPRPGVPVRRAPASHRRRGRGSRPHSRGRSLTPPPLAGGGWGEGATHRSAPIPCSAPRKRRRSPAGSGVSAGRRNRATTSPVPSVDPSSTTTSDQSRCVCASTDAIASPIQAAALKAGMTTPNAPRTVCTPLTRKS